MIADHQALVSGLKGLAIEASSLQLERLQRLYDLLRRWNRVYNLTRVIDEAGFITSHVLDSLAVQPFLQGNRILDMGTGAGFPGLPLAIFDADRDFVLLDASVKKIRFVRQAVLILGLKNVEVIQQRVERYQTDRLFDTIVTRAFADTVSCLRVCRHLLKGGGRLLAMKGKHPGGELAALSYDRWSVTPLAVPGLKSDRHLVEVEIVGEPWQT